MQRNWIGRCAGRPRRRSPSRARDAAIEVFTTRPDTLFGATYMVLAPEHPLVDELVPGRRLARRAPRTRWTGGARDPGRGRRGLPRARRRARPTSSARPRARTRPASSPAPTRPTRSTASRIPVFIADYVLMGYGTGAIMAVPGQDERDWEFATAFDLPIVRTVQPAEGHDPDDARSPATARRSTAANDESQPRRARRRRRQGARSPTGSRSRASASATVTYKLRDWLFSRQRYWGEPFPIVYDEDGVAASRCPSRCCRSSCPRSPTTARSTLDPDDAEQRAGAAAGRASTTGCTSSSTSATAPQRRYRRETNTMPQWAGLVLVRAALPRPGQRRRVRRPGERALLDGAAPRSSRRTTRGGVDLYVGGVEHAVLHLLYARFWHKVLFDLGHVSQRRAVPPAVQPGLHPGVRLHRRARRATSPADRGRRGRDGDASPGTASRSPASSARWASP